MPAGIVRPAGGRPAQQARSGAPPRGAGLLLVRPDRTRRVVGVAGDTANEDADSNGNHRAALAVALAEEVGKLMGRIARQARALHGTEAAMAESRSELHGNMREAAELGVSNKALATSYSLSRVRQVLASEEPDTGLDEVG